MPRALAEREARANLGCALPRTSSPPPPSSPFGCHRGTAAGPPRPAGNRRSGDTSGEPRRCAQRASLHPAPVPPRNHTSTRWWWMGEGQTHGGFRGTFRKHEKVSRPERGGAGRGGAGDGRGMGGAGSPQRTSQENIPPLLVRRGLR